MVAIGRSCGTVNASGWPFDVRAVRVRHLPDGELLSLDVYLDTRAMLKALAQ